MKKNSVIQPEGNYYDKYNSSNFIVQWMMKNYFAALDSFISQSGRPKRILEAGCGEGEVAGHVFDKIGKCCKMDAFDVSEKVISGAKIKYPDISFSTGNIYNIVGGGYDLVLCCEVLEHLEYPQKALKQIECAAKANGYIILSVPREPIWRLLNMVRGKYLKDFGNTPGHIQHWSFRGFMRFLKENGMKVEKVKKPLPWIMVLLKKE